LRGLPRLNRASLASGVTCLAHQDPGFALIVRRYGPPPLWARPAGFATLLRIILEQQVSLASARAMYRRLSGAISGVAPATVLALGANGLQQLGFTRKKASYACALAERVHSGRLSLPALARLPDADVTERLTDVPGIGPWTASIYLLMALRRPDVWPPGDLALHKALAGLEEVPTPSSREAETIAERWRPYRAVAARLLWHAYLSERRSRVRHEGRRNPTW
jgi:DNA-3-methyladenine glycosylase II